MLVPKTQLRFSEYVGSTSQAPGEMHGNAGDVMRHLRYLAKILETGSVFPWVKRDTVCSRMRAASTGEQAQDGRLQWGLSPGSVGEGVAIPHLPLELCPVPPPLTRPPSVNDLCDPARFTLSPPCLQTCVWAT